jgi:hypothetical protein
MAEYFSDRQRTPKPRTEEVIPPPVWGGIVALIQSSIATGAFASDFPERCQDGGGVTGTDESSFGAAFQAEMPGLSWPLSATASVHDGFLSEEKPFAPETLLILDLIEFCYRHVAKPNRDFYYKYFGHYHLTSFDHETGRREFCENVNSMFNRNGIAYELQENGQIIRTLPTVLGQALASTYFKTGDGTLDQMLEDSRLKFLNRDPRIRRESLERLWDCWERLKTLEDPDVKRRSVIVLLKRAAEDPLFRQMLDDEARDLNGIGNSFHIRHSEVTQSPVTDSSHIDYLFHRLFSMIHLLLKKRSVIP